MNVGTIVRVKNQVWYDTYAEVKRIDKLIVTVRIIGRVHKTTGKPGRVGPNEIWQRKPNQLETVHNYAHKYVS